MKNLPGTAPAPRRQHGAATLVVSMILLVAATLMVLFTANSAFVEQQIAANETRAKHAFAAAQAGHEHALDYMNNGGVNHTANPAAGDLADTIDPAPLTNGAAYRVAYCPASTTVVPPCPAVMPDKDAFPAAVCLNKHSLAPGADPTEPEHVWLPYYSREARVISCGWSDDGLARHLVTSVIKGGPPLANPLTNPLTTKGTVALNGNVSVANFYNNLTVWTGETLDKTSATGTTFIRDPDIAIPALPDMDDPASWENYPEAPEPGSCNNPGVYSCSTSDAIRGPDVIEYDTNLTNLTNDQLFEAVMGLPPLDYEASIPTLTDPASLDGLRSEVIWINGDTTLSGNIGTRLEPVVIVVEGNAKLGANTVIYGVLYVRGNLDPFGGPKVFGTAMVEGDVSGAGTLNVIYDPLAAMGANSIGAAGTLPGTWRDWN